MLVYCDSSALVKMVVDERESQDLEAWLEQQGAPQLCSSVIARTEVVRAVRRFGEDAVQLARELLRDVASIDLNNQLADTAADLDPTVRRSLDALHLAAAVRVAPSLKAMLSYDKRMIEAARAAGLTVHHPGA